MDDLTEFRLPAALDVETAPRLAADWVAYSGGASSITWQVPRDFHCSPAGATLLAALASAGPVARLDIVPTPTLWPVDTEAAAFEAASKARTVLRDSGVPGSLTRPAAPSLEEIAVNAAQHSKRPNTGFASAAREGNHFEVSVCDAGIGIRASLQESGAAGIR